MPCSHMEGCDMLTYRNIKQQATFSSSLWVSADWHEVQLTLTWRVCFFSLKMPPYILVDPKVNLSAAILPAVPVLRGFVRIEDWWKCQWMSYLTLQKRTLSFGFQILFDPQIFCWPVSNPKTMETRVSLCCLEENVWGKSISPILLLTFQSRDGK